MSYRLRRILPVAVAILGLGLIVAAHAHPEAAAEGRPRGYSFSADGVFPAREPGELVRPAGPGEVTGAAVFGADERVHIGDTSVYPWRAIAWLGLYSSTDFVGHCTGTFIGPDTLLTAAHCLWDSETHEWTHDIAVAPGKDGAWEPYGYAWASDWWVPDDYINSNGNNLWDWGVIKMSSTTLGYTVGWLQVAQLTTGTLSRPDFEPAIVGYPGDKTGSEKWTMWGGIKDAFLEVKPYDLYHDIDTYPGQSGSAIFSANTVDSNILGLIVGVHTTGGSTRNRGSRIDSEMLSDILTGCEVMHCTIAYTVEPTTTPTPTRTPTPSPTVSPTQTPPTSGPRPFKVFAPGLGRDR